MEVVFVKPNQSDIEHSRIAIWDNNPEHIAASTRWESWGGAYIVGNPNDPDAVYEVADTPEIKQAIRQKRLIDVTEEIFNQAFNTDLENDEDNEKEPDENPEVVENEISSTSENSGFSESSEQTLEQMADEALQDLEEGRTSPIEEIFEEVAPAPKKSAKTKGK